MSKNYKIQIHIPEELSQSSFFMTGLFEISKKKNIQIEFINSFHKKRGRLIVEEKGIDESNQEFPKAAYFRLVDLKTKKTFFFAVDTYDFENHFSTYALENCDFIFKRNYSKKAISRLPQSYRDKIYSLGLTFKVYSSLFVNDKNFNFLYLLNNFVKIIKFDSYILKRFLRKKTYHFNQLKLFKNPRYIKEYNQYAKGEEEILFFQTRCFANDLNTDVKEIHEQRYRLIKLLRTQYPEIFMGGFVPSLIANKKYKEAITNVPSDPHKYLNALKKAKIVIYTRGLAQSPAWKMAEYLSQAKVIISEPLTTDLPVPLTHGREVLFFNNDEELIANIELVLNNESLANKLSENARIYFEKYVHPEKSVERVLEIVLNKKL